MPFSPSIKVMALLHAPVLPNPGSKVIAPVLLRNCAMSIPTSPSEPVRSGSATVLPSNSRFTELAISVVDMTCSPGSVAGYLGIMRATSFTARRTLLTKIANPVPERVWAGRRLRPAGDDGHGNSSRQPTGGAKKSALDVGSSAAHSVVQDDTRSRTDPVGTTAHRY